MPPLHPLCMCGDMSVSRFPPAAGPDVALILFRMGPLYVNGQLVDAYPSTCTVSGRLVPVPAGRVQVMLVGVCTSVLHNCVPIST